MLLYPGAVVVGYDMSQSLTHDGLRFDSEFPLKLEATQRLYTCSDGLIVLHAIALSRPVQKFVIFGWINKVLVSGF